MYNILIVDDQQTMLKGIEFDLQENKNYKIFTAADKDTALQILVKNELDLIVSDLMLPAIEDGLEVIQTAKTQWYRPAIIAMTAFETIDNAVKAMQAGADDFISKGFGLDELYFRINNIFCKKKEINRLFIENQILRETLQQHYSDYQIIGKSKTMLELINKMKKVALDAKATCLIEGESGTGKDLIARVIHTLSNRRNAPFVPVNCAAIPETLIESEFFGHEKGAFTGAHIAKQGKFELANGGIIFLDEIGELPFNLQVRLLRVLEERNFYRIGGKNPINIDVMILAASNRNIANLVKTGKFREDLFFRLNVINIWIPPLRDRKDDIRPLALFFLEKFNKERKKNLRFSEKSLLLLESYDFKGNVRELRNIIEDAYVFCEGNVIKPEDLSLKKIKEQDYLTPSFDNNTQIRYEDFCQLTHKEAIAKFESQYFLKLLNSHYWNINETAKKAAITREWLSKKIKHLKLKERQQ
jgi:two-component system response regulator AtoC